MTGPDFLARIAERTGLASPEQARVFTRSVLEALGERLSGLEARGLADELPPELAPSLLGGPHGQELGLRELQARVAAKAAVRESVAVELTAVVCQTLAQTVRAEVIGRLCRELPSELSDLFREPAFGQAPPHLSADKRTLAEGRPGGARPLYAGRADRTQSESVAGSDDPHGDTKLSGAKGLTQEREGQTLAAGKTGSRRPLSEAKK